MSLNDIFSRLGLYSITERVRAKSSKMIFNLKEAFLFTILDIDEKTQLHPHGSNAVFSADDKHVYCIGRNGAVLVY